LRSHCYDIKIELISVYINSIFLYILGILIALSPPVSGLLILPYEKWRFLGGVGGAAQKITGMVGFFCSKGYVIYRRRTVKFQMMYFEWIRFYQLFEATPWKPNIYLCLNIIYKAGSVETIRNEF